MNDIDNEISSSSFVFYFMSWLYVLSSYNEQYSHNNIINNEIFVSINYTRNSSYLSEASSSLDL